MAGKQGTENSPVSVRFVVEGSNRAASCPGVELHTRLWYFWRRDSWQDGVFFQITASTWLHVSHSVRMPVLARVLSPFNLAQVSCHKDVC
jgi:hypothetical protein